MYGFITVTHHQLAEINFKLFPGFKLSGSDKTGVKTKVTGKITQLYTG